MVCHDEKKPIRSNPFEVGDVALLSGESALDASYPQIRGGGVVVSVVGDLITLDTATDYCFKWTHFYKERLPACGKEPKVSDSKEIYTGGSSDYYKVDVTKTTTPYAIPYTAECNDIIEALGMNFAEGNAFKALWRRAAQRTLGLTKAGAKGDGLYDAEKVEFFGKRLVEQSKGLSK